MKGFGRAGSTFSTVAVLAVVLAVATAGGAIAGGLVTSSQIANNTIRSIDVRDNSLGGVDIRDGSLAGADIRDGSLSSADLAPGLLSSVLTSPLPHGKTVRGTIGEQVNNLLAGDEVGVTASLPVPAPVALDDAHVAVAGTADDPGGVCTGSETNPTAAPGYVCIYEWTSHNASAGTGYIWSSDASANEKYGFQLSFNAVAAGTSYYFANWAYTAP